MLPDGDRSVADAPMDKSRTPRYWMSGIVLAAVTLASSAVGYLLDLPCRAAGWELVPVLRNLCYSDIPTLYADRGLADGIVPYFQQSVNGTYLEYPVLTGGFMYLIAALVRSLVQAYPHLDMRESFFDLTVIAVSFMAIVTVLATAFTVRTRRWDALMVALAPTAILAGTINWDWLAVALTSISLLLWARNRPLASGVMLGLAVATKFYPVIVIAAIVLLGIRAGRPRAQARMVVGAVLAWTLVNLPVALLAPEGWKRFYSFSAERPEDYGSPWLATTQLFGASVPAEQLNDVAMLAFAALAVLVGLLVWFAPTKPRIAQVAFLLVAAFVLTNKVYSPQYVLWLIPLAVLARPNWRDFLIWQVGELWYFVSVWSFIDFQMTGTGVGPAFYAGATLAHIGATVYFSAMVVRDILVPAHDPVREADPNGIDDPGGGPFDGADRGTASASGSGGPKSA